MFSPIFQQYLNYIIAISFIGEGNQSTHRKPPTCCKSCDKLYHIKLYPVQRVISRNQTHIFKGVRVRVFNATFNNISVISWRSDLLVEETGVPRENHWPVTSQWQTSHNVVSSTPRLREIQTHNIRNKSNYWTIMAAAGPLIYIYIQHWSKLTAGLFGSPGFCGG